MDLICTAKRSRTANRSKTDTILSTPLPPPVRPPRKQLFTAFSSPPETSVHRTSPHQNSVLQTSSRRTSPPETSSLCTSAPENSVRQTSPPQNSVPQTLVQQTSPPQTMAPQTTMPQTTSQTRSTSAHRRHKSCSQSTAARTSANGPSLGEDADSSAMSQTSNEQGSHAPTEGSLPASKRGVRGPSRQIKSSTLTRTMKKKIHVTLHNVSNLPDRATRSLLSNDIGAIVRSEAPMNYEFWRHIPQDVRVDLMEELTVNFDIPLEDDRCYKYVNKVMNKAYNEFKYELHDYYLSFEKDEDARAAPPDEMADRDVEQWQKLCDIFSSPAFLKRSEANKVNRTKKPINHCAGSCPFGVTFQEAYEAGEKFPDVVTFKKVHHKKGGKTWTNELAKEKYDKMMEKQNAILDDIMKEYPEGTTLEDISVPVQVGTQIVMDVMGTKPGRAIRGLGYGRFRDLASSSTPPSNSTTKELEQLRAQLQEEKAAREGLMQQIQFLLPQLQTLIPGLVLPPTHTQVQHEQDDGAHDEEGEDDHTPL